MTWLDITKRLFSALARREAFAGFSSCVFLDTNIILEGKQFNELPWSDIDPDGPILVLLTPTVLSEVDSKKRDGRLATKAREFNRMVGPIATSGQPLVVVQGPPAVSIGLATCDRIPWGKYEDLDPQDADSWVIAEALHTRGPLPARRVVVSHDIKPISMATRHGLSALHVSDDWIRPPEPSRSDREIQRLTARLRELQENEPNLHLKVRSMVTAPVEIYKVSPLSAEDQDRLALSILKQNPSPPRPDGILAFSFDSTLRDRYRNYEFKAVPAFVAAYHSKLELVFCQIPIELVVSNGGTVRADNLVVKLSVSSGWLNERAVFFPAEGPRAPKERNDIYIPPMHHSVVSTWRPGKHDMDLAIEPKRSKLMEVHCEDFRNGRTWAHKLVLWLDPNDAAHCVISTTATAANMHGEVAIETSVPKGIKLVDAKDLVNVNTVSLLREPYIKSWLESAVASKNFDKIEWGRETDSDDD